MFSTLFSHFSKLKNVAVSLLISSKNFLPNKPLEKNRYLWYESSHHTVKRRESDWLNNQTIYTKLDLLRHMTPLEKMRLRTTTNGTRCSLASVKNWDMVWCGLEGYIWEKLNVVMVPIGIMCWIPCTWKGSNHPNLLFNLNGSCVTHVGMWVSHGFQ